MSLLSKDSSLDILNFDTKLLQIAAPYINVSLNNIFNVSITHGFLPEDWKLARTTPVYKGKGSKDDISNYRPILVVCHIAKLIEKEVQCQFLSYLQTHNLINIDQHMPSCLIIQQMHVYTELLMIVMKLSMKRRKLVLVFLTFPNVLIVSIMSDYYLN